MSSHDLTVLVFAVLGGALVLLELAGHVPSWPVPTARELIRAARHRRPVMVLVVLAWWWVGWHFFATPGG
jgi:Family of unknown function (DUF6186)